MRVLVIAIVLSVLGGCRSHPDPPTTTATARATAAPPVVGKATATSPTPDATTPSRTTVRLLTYNVLATPIFPELRLEAIVALLDEADADIVALQEVPSWMVKALTAPDGKLARYRHTTDDGAPFLPGGQLILARHPIVATRAALLPGKQRRTVLVATVDVAGTSITVATSHMESFLEDGPMRAQQLDVIFPMLAAADHAVFMGDFNFGDGAQPETEHLDAGFTDVWRALHPDAPGFTWRNDENPMAGIGAFVGEPNRRLDRILVRSARLTPKAIRIVGNEPAGQRVLATRERMMIEPPDKRRPDDGEPTIAVFPSDHYGLLAELAVGGG